MIVLELSKNLLKKKLLILLMLIKKELMKLLKLLKLNEFIMFRYILIFLFF